MYIYIIQKYHFDTIQLLTHRKVNNYYSNL